MLGPFKCEMIFGENEIGIIHDFSTEEECKHIINKSSPKLKSTPYTVGGKMLQVSSKRTSKHVMFKENEDDTFMDLEDRIGLATRMKLNEKDYEGGEEMQVYIYIMIHLQRSLN